jgi:ParB family chromosome partitioning protein
MLTGTPETVTLVPINRIEILNSRDRNMKVFEEIVDNIRAIGLKKPSLWPSGRVTTATRATC